MKLSAARIVVTGAQTQAGRDILACLADQGAVRKGIVGLESGRVATGEQVSFGENDVVDVKSSDDFDFKGVHIVFHVGEGREAASLAKKATAAGALFIDCSGIFAMDPDVPLIVADVNEDALQKAPKNIVANPNSLSIFLSMALRPLHLQAKVTRAVISTYQSVSHWGRGAQDELFSQTKALFMAMDMKFNSEHLPKQIAFNAYPMVGIEREDGFTDVEWNTISQIKKILDTKIKLAINTVTIPAFVGDGMMVNVETAEEISPIKAAMWMTGQKGLGVLEDSNDIPTHAEINAEEFAYVARLRDDFSVENGLSFWLIGDNIRRGGALNAVKIAELYLKTH